MGDIYVHDGRKINAIYLNQNLYDYTNSVGLCGALIPISCTFEETYNGTSELTMVHPIDDFGKWKSLVCENVLAVDVPCRFVYGNSNYNKSAHAYCRTQLFRIYSTEIKSYDGTITVCANHISYDYLYSIQDINVAVTKNYKYSASQWIGKFLGDLCQTDITTKRTVDVDYNSKDMINILLDPDEGICELYNGHLLRDNYHFYVESNKTNTDRGFSLEYGKNILGISYKVDYSSICSYVKPFYRTEETPALNIFTSISNKMSPAFERYAVERIMALCPHDASAEQNDGDPSYEDVLTQEAQKLWDSGAHLPSVSVSVDFEMLSNDERYNDIAGIEQVYLYDTVRVFYPQLGVDINATVNRIVYDCINNRLTNIEIGNVQKRTSTVQSWDVSSVSANKIIGGTISAGLIKNGTIKTDKMESAFVGYVYNIPTIKKGTATGLSCKASSTTDTTVTFGEDFTDVPTVVCSIYTSTQTASFAGVSVQVVDGSVTKSGFKLRVNNNTTTTRTPKINWIAVGK